MDEGTKKKVKGEDERSDENFRSVRERISRYEELNKKKPEYKFQAKIKKQDVTSEKKTTSYEAAKNFFEEPVNKKQFQTEEKLELTLRKHCPGSAKLSGIYYGTQKRDTIGEKFKEADQQNSLTTFKKRGGVTDHGQKFEDLMAADVVLRLTTNPEIKNFVLSSNDASFGAADDIVFDVTYSNVHEKYAMQLKYRNTKKKNKLANWLTKPNNHIMHYCKEYQKLSEKHGHFIFILCTNRDFDLMGLENETGEGSVILVKNKNDELYLKIREHEPPFFQKDKRSRCYKFRIDQTRTLISAEKTLMYKTFFNNFILQTNHMDVDEFEKNIWEVFRKQIVDRRDAFREFIDYIEKWSSKEGKKYTLQKTLVIRSISLFLVSPYIQTFHVINSSFYKESAQSLIKSAIMIFNVTFFDPSHCDKLRNLWYDFRNNLTDFAALSKDMNKYQLIHPDAKKLSDLTDQECIKCLWVSGKLPIIVDCNRDVLKAIELTKNLNLKFILLTTNSTTFSIPKIFRNISDLKFKDSRLYAKILQLCCTFQNKRVSLESLINFDERISNIITPNELLSIADNSLEIDKTDTDLPYYINRLLTKTTISLDFLKNFDESTLILISCCDPKKLKKFISLPNVTEIDESKLKDFKLKDLPPKTILVKKDECTLEFFDSVCKITGKKQVHHCRSDNSFSLEWVSTKGNVRDIKRYHVRNQYIRGSTLPHYEFYNNINVICDDAGTGKTTLIKNFLKSASANYWTIFITVRNHYSYFLKNGGDFGKFAKYVLQDISKNLQNFEKKILKVFMEKKFVRFVWDGLDEVTDENFNKILDLISNLNEQGYKQWITARNSCKNILEERLTVISKSLKEFDEKNQDEYMNKRLKHSTKNSTLDFKNFQKNKTLFRTDLLKNPLHIFIFVELLLKSSVNYEDLLNQKSSIVDLYERFIDAKLDYYNEDKTNQKMNNEISVRRTLQQKRDTILMYEKLAASLYFQDKFPLDLDILDNIKNKKDEFGIIKFEKGNEPDFFHNSFGEYFAASFLANTLKNVSSIPDLIFQNQSIRYFFDLIVSKECPAHNAVLHKNYDLLKKCTDDQLNMKDKFKRNALHVACSWGTRYIFLPCWLDKSGHTLRVEDVKKFSSALEDESLEHKNILEYLSGKCDPLEVDDFNLNSFKYACINHCFLSFATLKTRYKLRFQDFQEYVGSIMYHAVRFDYPNVFDTFSTIPLIKDLRSGKSLLCLAVCYQSVNCVKKILSLENIVYKTIVEKGSENLLTLAFDLKNDEILMLLLSNGGKLKNETTTRSNSPVFLSLQPWRRRPVNTGVY